VARNLCLLIAFTCSLAAADEGFWFSYKIVTQDKLVVFEERNISPQMQIVDTKKYTKLCRLDIAKKQHQSTQHFLNESFDTLLECFYPMKSIVVNHTLVELNGMIERTALTIIPTKFTVDFKDDFANIKAIK